MLEEIVEIVIPTYNRAEYLDSTLNALSNSPFKDCKITIRDNASPDSTPEVCEKYSKYFSNFHIIRNKKNIGGNANILRSYEKAEAEYVWVIADNDIFDFSRCDDFIQAIESCKYDAIICSSGNYVYEISDNPDFDTEGLADLLKKESNKENYLENSCEELVSIIKEFYFSVLSFIPATVYRTSLIDFEYLLEGSNFISKSYPHFPLLAKVLNKNLLTYKTKYDVVLFQTNPEDSEIGPLKFLSRRIYCSLLIENDLFKKYASLDSVGLWHNLAVHIGLGKVVDEENYKYYFIDLIATLYKIYGFFGIIYIIYSLIFYLVPKGIYKYAYKNVFKKG